jgi:hypothetical protein
VKVRDRIRRWWNPGKWRDEHPEVSDGEGFDDTAQKLAARRAAEAEQLPKEGTGI